MVSIQDARLGSSCHHHWIYWQPCFIFCLGRPQDWLCNILCWLEMSLLSLAGVLEVPSLPAKENRPSSFYPPCVTVTSGLHSSMPVTLSPSASHRPSYSIFKHNMQPCIMCVSTLISADQKYKILNDSLDCLKTTKVDLNWFGSKLHDIKLSSCYVSLMMVSNLYINVLCLSHKVPSTHQFFILLILYLMYVKILIFSYTKTSFYTSKEHLKRSYLSKYEVSIKYQNSCQVWRSSKLAAVMVLSKAIKDSLGQILSEMYLSYHHVTAAMTCGTSMCPPTVIIIDPLSM